MKYLKKYNLFESIKLESEYPSQEDVQEFFYDLTDSSPDSKCILGECGYSYFTTDDVVNKRGVNRTQLIEDMKRENWINKECFALQTKWKDIFIDLSKQNYTKEKLKSIYGMVGRPTHNQLYFDTEPFLRSPKNNHIMKNILDGTIPAYSLMYLDLGYCEIANEFASAKAPSLTDKMEILSECFDRFYSATGFRPIGNIWDEEYVDEETGNRIRLLRCESLQLYNCTDIEYRNLCEIFPSGNHTKELTKRFL